jgi:hypothetical protein
MALLDPFFFAFVGVSINEKMLLIPANCEVAAKLCFLLCRLCYESAIIESKDILSLSSAIFFDISSDTDSFEISILRSRS